MIDLAKRIGVEIITRNRPDYLAVLLSSLLRQTKKEWDLFILDNSDVPVLNFKLVRDVIERIKQEGHLVIYDVNGDEAMKRNIGASRDEVMRKDDLEICCRIDDDSWIEPDYLELLYEIIIADEKIGAVGGTVPYLGINQFYKKMPKVFNRIWKGDDGRWNFEDDGHWSYNERGCYPSHHLRSSFMFRKKAMLEAGGNVAWAGSTGFREETAVSINLMRAGYRLLTVPQARAWHLLATGTNREDNGETKMRKQMENEALFRAQYEPLCEELLKRGVL